MRSCSRAAASISSFMTCKPASPHATCRRKPPSLPGLEGARMNIAHKKKIVLLGMMSKMPVAGNIWLVMQYLIGFQRLGYDVYYVEAHGCTPRALMQEETDDVWAAAAQFIDRLMRRFDM